jgi:hypothetical protein
MAREWEKPDIKVRDSNDFWYYCVDLEKQERKMRRFDPNDFEEYDLRYGEPRLYKYSSPRYLAERTRRKNRCRGLF